MFNERRRSNEPVEQTVDMSPHTYDTVNGYTNVSVSNLRVLEYAKRKNERSGEKLLPQFEQALQNKTKNTKSIHRVKGGGFSKSPRKNDIF